jgi:hypothetical protein
VTITIIERRAVQSKKAVIHLLTKKLCINVEKFLHVLCNSYYVIKVAVARFMVQLMRKKLIIIVHASLYLLT